MISLLSQEACSILLPSSDKKTRGPQAPEVSTATGTKIYMGGLKRGILLKLSGFSKRGHSPCFPCYCWNIGGCNTFNLIKFQVSINISYRFSITYIIV